VRPDRTTWTAVAVFALLAAVMAPVGSLRGSGAPFAAEAQNLGQRVVMGFVTDADGTPVVGATVFLRDVKSKNIRSYTTAERGRFRFAQVSMSRDQELWAEKDGKKSAVKIVSTWNSSAEFETELRLK
jgi:hypothetical protein